LEEARQQQASDAASLAGEKAARLAAEDAELSRSALADQAQALRGRLEAAQRELGETKAAAGKVKEELDLMTVSRDTWRVSGGGWVWQEWVHGWVVPHCLWW
jgi:hypothetical protein